MPTIRHHLRHHAARARHHLKNTFIAHEGNDFRPHAFRPVALRVYAYLLIGTKVGVAMWVGLIANPAKVTNITADTITQQTNAARVARKVGALKTNPLLAKAAQAKAADMATKHYFAHVSPSNVTPWYWFKKAGYSYRFAGENLAIDFTDSEDVLAAWLGSPSHRRNLLSTNYTEIGVAVTTGKIDGADALLVVQMFGAPIPPPTSKKAAPKAPTKLPIAKAKAPAPAVLGETAPAVTPPTPAETLPIQTPTTPVITGPAPDAVTSAAPIVRGTAAANARVTILADGSANGETTADADGAFAVTMSQPLADGSHVLVIRANETSGVIMNSAPVAIRVDTTSPSITSAMTFTLPSWFTPGMYDIRIQTSSDAAKASLRYGGLAQEIALDRGRFAGQVRLDQPGLPAGTLQLSTSDAAGNGDTVTLLDPDLFVTGVAQPPTSFLRTALDIVMYSRTFMMLFFGAALLLTLINVSRHWRRIHHPTLLGSLAILYLTGALLML